MKNIFEHQEVNALIQKALSSNEPLNTEIDGCKIKVIPNKGSLHIEIEQESELAKFNSWLETLPEDVFTGACLSMSDLDTIVRGVYTDDPTDSINQFKDSVRNYCLAQIARYNNIISET